MCNYCLKTFACNRNLNHHVEKSQTRCAKLHFILKNLEESMDNETELDLQTALEPLKNKNQKMLP